MLCAHARSLGWARPFSFCRVRAVEPAQGLHAVQEAPDPPTSYWPQKMLFLRFQKYCQMAVPEAVSDILFAVHPVSQDRRKAIPPPRPWHAEKVQKCQLDDRLTPCETPALLPCELKRPRGQGAQERRRHTDRE